MLTNYAVAPGKYLEEWMEDNDMSLSRTASLLGYSEAKTQTILDGTAVMTNDTAERLKSVVGGSVSHWKNLDALYRSDLERLGLTA